MATKDERTLCTELTCDILMVLTVWALVATVIYGLILLYPLV